MKKILVIAAHPDDEVLGCGGTMARLTAEGHEVHILIAAEGLTSRQGQRNTETLSNELTKLQTIARKANEHLGVKSIEFLGFPDNRMDSVDLLDVVKKVEEKLSRFPADDIYTHFPSDLNIDHRLLSEAVLTAARPLPGQNVKQVFFFEVPSATDWKYDEAPFNPNTFVNVHNHLKDKMRALSEYESEMRPYPHARSMENVENLAKVRGATVGFPAAEAFVLARNLVK